MSRDAPGVPNLQDLFKKDAATRAAKGDGDVVLGGLWDQPHLSWGYARAARTLRDAMDSSPDEPDAIAPIFYCARHSVELALKDLLTAYQENQRKENEICNHDGAPSTAKPIPDKTFKIIGMTHDLGNLLGWVQKWMPHYVMASWPKLVAEIQHHEKNAPDRFRYSYVGKPDKLRGDRSERSFERLVVIPIDRILEHLDAFMEEAAYILPESEFAGADHWSALQDLGMEATTLSHELYRRGLY